MDPGEKIVAPWKVLAYSIRVRTLLRGLSWDLCTFLALWGRVRRGGENTELLCSDSARNSAFVKGLGEPSLSARHLS